MADPTRPPPRLWLALVLLTLGCACWIQFLGLLSVRSPDLGWHLASGRWIVEQGQVPLVDPFCFTSEGIPWVDINWLAQSAMYRVYRASGLSGLVGLRVLLLSVTLVFLWLNLRARRVSPALGLLALALSAWALSFVVSVRPRLISFALLSCFAWILARPDPEDRLGLRPALVLGGLLVLWNQLHGGFVYGYCALGADALGTAISSRRRGETLFPRRSLLLISIVVLGLLSFGLHPLGYEVPRHVARYVELMGPEVIAQCAELQPLDFTTQTGRFAELCLGLAVLGCLFGHRPRLRDVLVALPLTHLMFQMRRGVNPLAIVALPWVAAAWVPVWRLWSWGRALDRSLALLWRAWGPTLAGVALVSSLTLFVRGGPGSPGDLEDPRWDRRELPVAPIATIRGLGGQGRVFSPWSLGGTLVWGVYPEARAYSDGRGDIHGQGFSWVEGQAILRLQPGWHERLSERSIQFVLLERKESLAEELRGRPEWQVIHQDETWIVFQRPR